MSTDAGPAKGAPRSELFSSRNVFILSAIGSAVGLGNIWRFPYVAYDNGGGAFIIPYLVALLTAGVPLLLFDYAIGHRYRGSAPLSLRRMGGGAEVLGWLQVGVCFVIALYYAVIVAWAGMYTVFSVTRAWGDDPKAFLYEQVLRLDEPGFGGGIVPEVLWPQLLVWITVLAIIALGVGKGISVANSVFMPLLVVMFLLLVVQALLLPGALDGLNALFTPDWQALGSFEVWAAAYGQIFFSLSVGFGIMVTYSSYLKRKTDLAGSGAVVAFSNSGFELLAGIGVFAALGFMAQLSGSDIEGVAGAGIGLAFVAFPSIISAAPAGGLIGVLFFGSLLFAGLSSLISILEVVVAAVRDKLGIGRVAATAAIGVPMAILSLLLFPTTTGLYKLDVIDEFVNKYGILLGALATVVTVTLVLRKLGVLRRHIDRVSSIRFGTLWTVLAGAVVPVTLTVMLGDDLLSKLREPYGGGDYDGAFLAVFGWGVVGALAAAAVVLTLLPWSARTDTAPVDDGSPFGHHPASTPSTGEVELPPAAEERGGEAAPAAEGAEGGVQA